MWIKTHGNSLVNTDKLQQINIANRDKYAVVGWRSEDCVFLVLAGYKQKEQAEQAVEEIYSHISRGHSAMIMPVYDR